MKLRAVSSVAALVALTASTALAGTVFAVKGKNVDMVLLPKFLGILPFDQANHGAMEAHSELENPGTLLYTGPTAENSVAGQIELMEASIAQGQAAVMLSNNAGDHIAPAAKAAQQAGTRVITWDSPIPSSEGETLFVAPVDFDDIGVVMADMAYSILGGEGQFATLSTSPDAANQNAWIASMDEALKDAKYAGLKHVDVVYGDDRDDVSYGRALELVDEYPDLGLIMAPTTVGIAAAARAMQDKGLCDQVNVSGLGLPAEMIVYSLDGCAPELRSGMSPISDT
ncbi:MAG: substrate-binding domain-containing protein [Alphaproteobacteria bacterium]|nr:substrate-binding domain-containing protein [Alphaproteobacteria bacterium]